jgi:CubicO group peptidase (beta-lactamase class C family)
VDLEALAVDLLHRHRVPGVAVGFVERSGATRIVTVGNRGRGLGPLDRDSVFGAASLSKPVFASGVMSLVDRGLLELDRPLGAYVAEPDLGGDGRAASITARMVLDHTTGLPNWRNDGALHLRWSPGTRWGYSGEGYSYLQRVVEHLAGTTLDRYLADTVLGPLGMSDSSFVWQDVDETHLAVGHGPDGNPSPPFRPLLAKGAAGGMFTTVSDYLRFVVHSLTDHRRMFEPQVWIDDELAWGLGWGIERTDTGQALWQWGDDPGYKNFVIARPVEGDGAVVFTNGDRGAAVYSDLVRHLLPGRHPALDVWHRSTWIDSWVVPRAGA